MVMKTMIEGRPWEGKAADHPILRAAVSQSIALHNSGHVDHPATAQQFWSQQNTAIKASAAYRAILAVAAEKAMPAHFATDLSRVDREWILKAGDSEHFLWGIRSSGTALVFVDKYAVENFDAECKYFPDLTWYYWDGFRLEQWSTDEARFYLETAIGIAKAQGRLT